MKRPSFYLIGLLVSVLAFGLSACYRDAGDGESRAPTTANSNNVVVRQPTTAPTDMPTIRVIPTFTPANDSPTETLAPGGPNPQGETTETPEPLVVVPPDETGDTVIQPGLGEGLSSVATPTPTNTAAPALPTPTSIPIDKCSYFVVEGDTLTQIAVKLDISTEAFIQANPALQINPNSLSIGQELRIPNCESDLTPTVESNTVDLPPFATVEGTSPQITLAPGQTIQHLVQPGENLYRISLRYGVTVDAIKQANGLQSDLINVGDTLIIPQN